ncbi:MAG: tetratricopeptide repeat protein [Polyangiaceae bacterium]|nr:tetratricopeptide repeat protein [Polyangiaceae bacterium]
MGEIARTLPKVNARNRAWRSVERAFLVILLAGLAVGCAKKGVGVGPQVAPGQPPPVPGAPVMGPQGQQFAVSDAPTGGPSAVERPKMNAAAAQAYAAGLSAFQAGDLAGAQLQFTSATQADPRAFQAFYSLGTVRERLSNRAGAISAYRQALAIVRDYEPALVGVALAQAQGGQEAEAEAFLQSARAQFPSSAAVLAALAEVKSILGDSGEAQKLAQEALKKNPDYRPAMVTLARDHYRRRRLDLALYALKGILDGYGDENPARDKNNAVARLLRGLIYKEQGQKAPAIDEFRKALELRPDLVEARVQLAAYLLEAGNAVDALPLLEGALRYDSNNVLAHLNLGDAYRLLGRPQDAKRELEWVAKKDPSLPQVHYNLGLLYLFSDNIPGVSAEQASDMAIDALQKFQQMRPRGGGGRADDTEELITRAKTKKALIEAQKADAAAASAPEAAPAAGAPAAPAPAAGATPAPAAPAGAAAFPTAPEGAAK